MGLARDPQMGAERPESQGLGSGVTSGAGTSAGSPRQGASHLQLQGRPLPCLHTGQAAAASLDAQEDGDLGAVQASVGECADLLWEEKAELRPLQVS